MTYKEVYKLTKRADYVDEVHQDIVDALGRVPQNDQPGLGDRFKALFSTSAKKKLLSASVDKQRVQALILKNYFDRILTGQHGIGQFGVGGKQKGPAKELFINTNNINLQGVPYNKWKAKTKSAVISGDASQLDQLVSPIDFYVKTKGQKLQTPDWYTGQDMYWLQKVYKRALSNQILQKLNKKQKEI